MTESGRVMTMWNTYLRPLYVRSMAPAWYKYAGEGQAPSADDPVRAATVADALRRLFISTHIDGLPAVTRSLAMSQLSGDVYVDKAKRGALWNTISPWYAVQGQPQVPASWEDIERSPDQLASVARQFIERVSPHANNPEWLRSFAEAANTSFRPSSLVRKHLYDYLANLVQAEQGGASREALLQVLSGGQLSSAQPASPAAAKPAPEQSPPPAAPPPPAAAQSQPAAAQSPPAAAQSPPASASPSAPPRVVNLTKLLAGLATPDDAAQVLVQVRSALQSGNEADLTFVAQDASLTPFQRVQLKQLMEASPKDAAELVLRELARVTSQWKRESPEWFEQYVDAVVKHQHALKIGDEKDAQAVRNMVKGHVDAAAQRVIQNLEQMYQRLDKEPVFQKFQSTFLNHWSSILAPIGILMFLFGNKRASLLGAIAMFASGYGLYQRWHALQRPENQAIIRSFIMRGANQEAEREIIRQYGADAHQLLRDFMAAARIGFVRTWILDEVEREKADAVFALAPELYAFTRRQSR